MILLDTHVLVWLDAGSHRLGEKSLSAINTALSEENLFTASISFWEIAMLVEKERLEMQQDLNTWRHELLASGLKELPLTGSIAIRAGSLYNFHGDPADRIITATAIELSATLVTADRLILNWNGSVNMLDASK